MNFEDIRKLISGFQPAKLVLTALELGVFDALAKGSKSAAELGAALELNPRATEICCNALTAMGILSKEGDAYANAPEAAADLVKSSPDYKGSILRHIHNTWEDWSELETTWRTGTALCERKQGGTVPTNDEGMVHFILGMENLTREVAPKLAGLLSMEGKHNIIDLGGGPGNYCLAFAARCPEARVVHFDLPETSAIAQQFVAGKPGGDRVEFVQGDFLADDFTERLGSGYDFIWLSQILHMFGEEPLRTLLGQAVDALAPGGVIGIHEHFLNEDKVSPPTATAFGTHMLAATPGGRTYSFEELERWLAEAGMGAFERIDYGAPSRVLTSVKA